MTIESESGFTENHNSAPLIHLATAIVEQRAMIYVGAGASVPSGGPLWSELLEWLCDKGAEPLLRGTESLRYLKNILEREKKHLEAADLLQEILDNDLARFLREKFAKVSAPSSIHLNIARIPFRASITTNYDDLLELAYANSIFGQDRPYVLTWKNPKDILQAVQDNIRFVLKTHGKVDDGSSLILSSRQYRNLIFANPLYWQIMKWLFMTKTCLFVGCSLTDPDLLHVFEEAITESGEDFGPHYALLPKDEAPEIRVQNLWRRLKVKAILLEPGFGDKKKENGNEKAWVEAACSRVLVDLAGEVAKQRIATRPPALPTSDGHEFFLIGALEKLLQTSLEVTGSFRGDICLPPDVNGGRESDDLRYRVSLGPTDPELKKKHVARASVCGIAYHEATPQKGVYIRDVESEEEIKNRRLKDDSDIRHLGKIDYFPGHPDVKSELALPILADGVRVGVLNLESRLKEAYGEGHITAAQWYAEKAGRLFGAAQERNRRGRGLRPEVIKKIQPHLLDVLRELWEIRNANATRDPHGDAHREQLECVVFNADYINGKLTGLTKHPNDKKEMEVTFDFDTEPSFACTIFRERSGAFCPDAKRAIEQKHIASTYALKLHLSGSLIGFPVYIHGYVVGVVVCWHRDGRYGYVDWRDMELFRRAAHLIANASNKDFMLGPLKDSQAPEESGRFSEAELGEEEKRIHLATQHINGVKETLQLCMGPTSLVDGSRLMKASDSDERLHQAWLNVAEKIASLLELLWIRYGAEEKNWLLPTRARLWVASGKANGNTGKIDHPLLPSIFGLVMELSLDKEDLRLALARFLEPQKRNFRNLEHWSNCAKDVRHVVENLFRRKAGAEKESEPMFLTIRPERPAGSDADGKTGETVGEISLKEFMPAHICAACNKQENTTYKEAFKDPHTVTIEEPNMNFLLSRIWADAFTRFQRTETERDPLAEWIKKDARAPVYAAPIIRVLSDLQQEEQEAVVIEKNLPRTRRREVAGVLVFDSLDLPNKAFRCPTDEGHKILQNELLHTIDLFTACLAESREFRKHSNGEEPLQKRFVAGE